MVSALIHSSGKGGGDASVITFTPTVLADWDGDADPGNVDDALDQLAERVDDVEAAGGGTAIWDTDHDTGIQVEEAADEDIIRFDIAGTEQMTLAALGLKVNMNAALGPNAVLGGDAGTSSVLFYVREDANVSGEPQGIGQVLSFKYTGTRINKNVFGMLLDVYYSGISPGTGTVAYGLSFASWQDSARVLGAVYGIRGYLRSSAAGVGAITLAVGCHLPGGWVGAIPVTVYGLRVMATIYPAGVTTAYGLRAEDSAATTSYLLELGPATPYFRVVGGAAPGANLTNLYVNEGGTLRQVQVRIADGTGHVVAADKVLVVV